MLEVELSETGDMRVRIPGSKNGRGHDVYIPISVEGMRILKRLLMERKGQDNVRLGEPGAPTEHTIKMWLAEEKRRNPVGERRTAAPVKKKEDNLLIDLDLDLSDLDIKL